LTIFINPYNMASIPSCLRKMEGSVDNTYVFSQNEEIANAVSHAVGVVFSIIAFIVFLNSLPF
jgi:predicted membrane channel-forming protein YqfA (hemolysin III family)